MKIKIRLQKNLVGCCTLLQTFPDNGIKLLNSQHISSVKHSQLKSTHRLTVELSTRNFQWKHEQYFPAQEKTRNGIIFNTQRRRERD